MTSTETTFDERKFRELVLHLAHRSADDSAFGATKLNKLLFFSDFLAYGQLGAPITGACYQKLKWGPAPRELLPVQRAMAEDGDAIVERQSKFVPDRTVPKREADLSVFTPDEIAVVDEVIDALREDNATMVSERSHRFSVGWRLAEEREPIPYSTVFLHGDDAHPAAIEHGLSLAEEHGWLDEPAAPAEPAEPATI